MVQSARSDGSCAAVNAYRASLLRCHLADLDRRLVRCLARYEDAPCVEPMLDLVHRERAHLRGEIYTISALIDEADLDGLCELLGRVRALYSLVAGLEGAAEWHSPPWRSTWAIDADLGPVSTDHDYQRDRNEPVAHYERAWMSVFGRPGGRPLRALGFISGMAAMSTVIGWLGGRAQPIIASRDLYHETRFLLEGSAATPLWLVDEPSVEAMVELASRSGDCTIFVDAQSNDHRLMLTDWPRLLDDLRNTASAVTVVIDTSLLSLSCQPFLCRLGPGVRLITVESLTKFPQLGIDRVAGGLVVTDEQTASVLDRWREHSGTGLTVSSVRQLPQPCEETILERLERHQRNAERLAVRLRRSLSPLGFSVVHPSLGDHPSHRLGVRLGSMGSLVALTGVPATELRTWAGRAMDRAERDRVRLAQGTSFGFDATRLAVISDGATPYLRISVGDGSPAEIDAVCDVVAESA